MIENFNLVFHSLKKKSLKCFRSDKTSFLNIPWGRRKTNYFAWVVLKMHHRHWPRINSQRRRGEAFFSDGRFLKFSLAPSEQIETLKKGHKLRLKRSDLIMLRNFNWVENGQTNEAIANQQQNFECSRQKQRIIQPYSPKMSHLSFSIWAISNNFCPIKIDLSGNAILHKASVFQKVAKIDHFWHF